MSLSSQIVLLANRDLTEMLAAASIARSPISDFEQSVNNGQGGTPFTEARRILDLRRYPKNNIAQYVDLINASISPEHVCDLALRVAAPSEIVLQRLCERSPTDGVLVLNVLQLLSSDNSLICQGLEKGNALVNFRTGFQKLVEQANSAFENLLSFFELLQQRALECKAPRYFAQFLKAFQNDAELMILETICYAAGATISAGLSGQGSVGAYQIGGVARDRQGDLKPRLEQIYKSPRYAPLLQDIQIVSGKLEAAPLLLFGVDVIEYLNLINQYWNELQIGFKSGISARKLEPEGAVAFTLANSWSILVRPKSTVSREARIAIRPPLGGSLEGFILRVDCGSRGTGFDCGNVDLDTLTEINEIQQESGSFSILSDRRMQRVALYKRISAVAAALANTGQSTGLRKGGSWGHHVYEEIAASNIQALVFEKIALQMEILLSQRRYRI